MDLNLIIGALIEGACLFAAAKLLKVSLAFIEAFLIVLTAALIVHFVYGLPGFLLAIGFYLVALKLITKADAYSEIFILIIIGVGVQALLKKFLFAVILA
ncbi:hypothetical protein ONV78_02585 [Hahella sp. CR1]|uniref:hypothetical protein n=1 Tax=Hahella sp. CR1 TaxID=2992807 RepID=UPI00244153EF|nr:hypothetical protein [Hahella sp. CR1]MDG9666606.1 hypothetical protein [Hahella sp. CR1]